MGPTHVPGMLTLDELAQAAGRGEIDTVLTVFPDLYGRLVGKRITAPYLLDHVAGEGMHVCDYLLTCDMEMEVVEGYRFANWESGYGDLHAVPDLATLRRAAWLPNTALVLCDLLGEPDQEPVEVSPRRILQRQTARAAELGFTAKAGSEIEVYLFDDSYREAAERRYHDLRPASSYNEDYHILQGTKEEELVGAIRRAMDASGVPIEFSKGEAGLGQQEINLRYSQILDQADRNVIYKHAAKEIAWSQGKSVTFMAKWDEGHTGSSMHLHVSLWDTAGEEPLFPGGEWLDDLEVSDVFRWFLGGWVRHARELMVCYAPYPASYKRYRAESWAPTGVAWSLDNRTAGFRVVGRGLSLRIECRIPGADANPYLAYAATLAAGLDGVAHHIDPPAQYRGNVYIAEDVPRVPTTLREAMTEFERSELAVSALGEDVVEHYLRFLATEQAKFDQVVTCWERARYFERA